MALPLPQFRKEERGYTGPLPCVTVAGTRGLRGGDWVGEEGEPDAIILIPTFATGTASRSLSDEGEYLIELACIFTTEATEGLHCVTLCVPFVKKRN